MISIGKLAPATGRLENLVRGYIDFYQRELPAQACERAWTEFQQDTRVHALGAKTDGLLAGVTHFLTRAHTSAADVCYLQGPVHRAGGTRPGRGQGADRCGHRLGPRPGLQPGVLVNHQANATARRLYDQVADNRGFIIYQVSL